MSDRDQINRRDFIVTTAGAAGTASALAGATLGPAQAQPSPPPGFVDQPPFANNWAKPLSEVVHIDLSAAAPELGNEAVRERHRIYCHLLMKLMVRFWNGNKRGPLGSYPRRVKQMEAVQPTQPTQRYRGDMIADPDRLRLNWDRYVGHNIACIAVDGNGEIIDFDFNHNDFFRSSAEHAESRMVRRLFSLTDVFDSWIIGLVCRRTFLTEPRKKLFNRMFNRPMAETCILLLSLIGYTCQCINAIIGIWLCIACSLHLEIRSVFRICDSLK